MMSIKSLFKKTTEVSGNHQGPNLLGKFCDFGSHYWGRHWAYWGIFPSSCTVKKCSVLQYGKA